MKPKSDEDETALFREAIRGVKPLTHAARVTGNVPKPRQQARRARAGREFTLDETPHDVRMNPN